MKKPILASLLASMMLLNTACTDREIASGILGVIIGIGASRSHDRDRGHRHDRRRRGDHRRHSLDETYLQSSRAADASAYAKRFHLSEAAAEKLKAAFEGVQSRGLESFQAIGLSKKDVRTIAKRELPDASSLKALAGRLDISEARSRDLIKDMIQEFDDQAADVSSPYWQGCMKKGRFWRTPQNLFCKKTSWNGCSPETGATRCY